MKSPETPHSLPSDFQLLVGNYRALRRQDSKAFQGVMQLFQDMVKGTAPAGEREKFFNDEWTDEDISTLISMAWQR